MAVPPVALRKESKTLACGLSAVEAELSTMPVRFPGFERSNLTESGVVVGLGFAPRAAVIHRRPDHLPADGSLDCATGSQLSVLARRPRSM